MGTGETGGQEDLEQLRKLVELQSQIVEIARQNEATAKECRALREKLARELLRQGGQPGLEEAARRAGRRLAGTLAAWGASLLPPRLGN